MVSSYGRLWGGTSPFDGSPIDTRWPLFGADNKRGGWVWGPAMKYTLESVTLVTFAAFLAWSIKILAAWA